MIERFVSRNKIIALSCLILIWGCSYPIYKVAIPHTPPLLFAGMRATIGGAFLAILLVKSHSKICWNQHWIKYCISALLNTIFFFGIQTAALVYLPSGLLSILIYFQPVLLGLFAWLWLGEYMTPFKIIGLIIGFCGIAIASMEGFTVRISAIGIILGLSTAAVWALGVCYVKRVSLEIDAFWMVALQCTIGGAVLIGVGSLFESWSDISWSSNYFVGLGYGSTLGIPVAFILYYSLVNAGEVGEIGTFTFLVPIVSVLVGTVFLNEPLTYSLLTGLLLVVVSIYLVNYSKKETDRGS